MAKCSLPWKPPVTYRHTLWQWVQTLGYRCTLSETPYAFSPGKRTGPQLIASRSPRPPAEASPAQSISIAKKLMGALVSVLLHFPEKLILLGGQIIFVFFSFLHALWLHSVPWSVLLRKARLRELLPIVSCHQCMVQRQLILKERVT